MCLSSVLSLSLLSRFSLLSCRSCRVCVCVSQIGPFSRTPLTPASLTLLSIKGPLSERAPLNSCESLCESLSHSSLSHSAALWEIEHW